MRFKPLDWEYLAEGQMNVIFKYIGGDKSLFGCILRVRKATMGFEGDLDDSYVEHTWNYVKEMVEPLFGPSLMHCGIPVTVEREVLEGLQHVLDTTEERPTARRDCGLHLDHPMLVLMKDCSRTSSESGIAVELKPKWGMVPSKLATVNPIKRSVCRFCMHQQLKLAQGKIESLSHYCPMRLFSDDEFKIQNAINSLLENPQNNIRVLQHGQILFDNQAVKKETGSKTGKEVADCSIPFEVEVPASDEFVHVLQRGLSACKILEKIRSAQLLDCWDVEGVIRVFNVLKEDGGLPEGLCHWGNIDAPEFDGACPEDVSVLSNEVKIATLNRFLLSATLKDCSVMITINPVIDESRPCMDSGVWRVTSDISGKLYDVKATIIDMDPKPYEKIPYYFNLDQKIVNKYVEAGVEECNCGCLAV
eukprot:TRINITY_DN11759_c0_g1_i1.p1 TRINITY_DN11759_c0_g1~~TRINITY_DN11759_c0_g1_i1.p1  ORF type:complete len:419 (-),score=101.73 TRINITY_DN11759_c0_g1_i1:142-1398(-)